MLFDAAPPDSDQESGLLHWFLRGGLLGILLLGLGMLLPARWESLYHLLCPATSSDIGYDLGAPLSLAGMIFWILLILVTQFVIYGAAALVVRFVARAIRNRSIHEAQ